MLAWDLDLKYNSSVLIQIPTSCVLKRVFYNIFMQRGNQRVYKNCFSIIHRLPRLNMKDFVFNKRYPLQRYCQLGLETFLALKEQMLERDKCLKKEKNPGS